MEIIATFGSEKAGKSYRTRIAAYVVIPREDGGIAAVRGRSGFFLPGGGRDPGETPEETVRREVREELGREVALERPLGTVRQFFSAGEEGFFDMEATFFLGSLMPSEATEAENELIWVPTADVDTAFFHACHIWAVRQVSGTRIGDHNAS